MLNLPLVTQFGFFYMKYVQGIGILKIILK